MSVKNFFNCECCDDECDCENCGGLSNIKNALTDCDYENVKKCLMLGAPISAACSLIANLLEHICNVKSKAVLTTLRVIAVIGGIATLIAAILMAKDYIDDED